MKDFLLNQIQQLGPIVILLLFVGSFFVGIFVALIITAEKSKIKYTYYASQPWRQSLVIAHLGPKPIFAIMYSESFMRFLWRRLKKQWARIEAIKEIGKI